MRTSSWPIRAVALALTATVAVGCSSDDPATAPPETPPPATDAPEPEPEPPSDVVGELDDLVVADLSNHNTGLHRAGSDGDAQVATDEAAVADAVDAARRWLDAHLTDLQHGGPGRVVDAGLTGDAAELSAGLAHPDRPATGARYAVTVGARQGPEWLRVSVVVTREGADDATATFVFVPDDGDVRLIAAEPAANTAPPDGADGDAAADDADAAEEDAP